MFIPPATRNYIHKYTIIQKVSYMFQPFIDHLQGGIQQWKTQHSAHHVTDVQLQIKKKKKKRCWICIKMIKNYSADCMHVYPFM